MILNNNEGIIIIYYYYYYGNITNLLLKNIIEFFIENQKN